MGAFEFAQWRHRLDGLDRWNEPSRTDHQLAKVAHGLHVLSVQVSMLFAGKDAKPPAILPVEDFLVTFVEPAPKSATPADKPTTVGEAQRTAEGMFGGWLSAVGGNNPIRGPATAAP